MFEPKVPKLKLAIDVPDLPDKVQVLVSSLATTYSVRIHVKTKEKIDLINSVKQGLQEHLRTIIEEVVEAHWKKLYPDG